MEFQPNFKERSAPAVAQAEAPSSSSTSSESTDDSLDFFKSLAED